MNLVILIVVTFFSEELKEKFEGRLTRDHNGATYEVISRIMKGILNRKITVPGSFMG